MNYKPAVNPGAVNSSDRYLIVNTETCTVVESHHTRAAADHFCQVGNDHELRNNRPAVYKVIEREEV